MNCVRILALQKKMSREILSMVTCQHRNVGSGEAVGTRPVPSDFGRSVNPISTKKSRLCPPNYYPPFRFSDLPPSLLHTMSWPRHGNFNHGNCTQQWNNPHMQLDSPIKHSSVEHFFFPFQLSIFFLLSPKKENMSIGLKLVRASQSAEIE